MALRGGEGLVKTSIARDVLLVVLVTLAMFALASLVELNELILTLTRPLEPYQVDELPVTVLALVLAMTWFSWRRWQEANAEVQLRQAAQQALAETLAENRLLAQRNVLAQEQERRAIARELHDELGQSLNAIKLDAVAIRQRVSDEDDEVHQNAAAIIDLADHVHESVRTLTRQLRPVALDELGLRDALELLVTQWARRNAPVECQFVAEGDLDGLGELVNITVYRCVQECLTNITRHARAQRVDVGVRRTGPMVELRVSDDGAGLMTTAKHAGVGLVGLRERAQSLEGIMELASEPGKGVQVVVRLPLKEVKGD